MHNRCNVIEAISEHNKNKKKNTRTRRRYCIDVNLERFDLTTRELVSARSTERHVGSSLIVEVLVGK